MAGERTCINEDRNIWVEYDHGYIVLETVYGMGGVVYMDADTVAAFDKWRAELDADIALRQAAGF